MKYIKRKSPVENVTGLIMDTKNIHDKEVNAYSARVIDEYFTKKIAPTGVFPGAIVKYYGTGAIPNKFLHLNGTFFPVKDFPELYSAYKERTTVYTIGADNAADGKPFDVFYCMSKGADIGKYVVRAESSNYNPENNLITCKLNGELVYAERYMKWGDWINSDYNTASLRYTTYTDESTGIEYLYKSGAFIYLPDELSGYYTDTRISMDDYILNNVAYNSKTISFTINGSVYHAKEGMTWTEWCNSEYSPSSAKVGTSVVYFSTNNVIKTSAAYVRPSDVITANTAYVTVYYCCFVAGTQVLTTFNGDTCPIEKIKIGDTIVSYNTETGENYLTKVTKTIINPMSTCMAIVEFSNGSKLEMTDYHPIYTKNGWHSITDKNYDKLVIGDIAKTNLGWSEITNIKLYTLKEPIATYTLSVKDFDEIEDIDINDNFYANSIVVHNAGCK